MITSDQPTIFPPELLVTVSSKVNGTMLNRTIDTHVPDVIADRQRFCEESGIDYGAIVYQKIVYDMRSTYDVLKEVGVHETTRYTPDITADALYTREAGVGLFLPVADCVATVVYDPVLKHLALLHLGRHSTLSSLIQKTIAHFVSAGSKPTDLLVWMSPSAKRETYVLEWFEQAGDPLWRKFCTQTAEGYQVDLPGYNKEQFVQNGLNPAKVFISPVDTTTNPNYFSHSAGDTEARIAVLAMMR